MARYEENFEEYLILKARARSTGVSIAALLRFKDRDLRTHLTALHGSGRPLAELADYIATFYQIQITPQQLRRVLQKSDQAAFNAAADSYRQHRHMKKHEKIISAIGASL
jgi:hypothetical protein